MTTVPNGPPPSCTAEELAAAERLLGAPLPLRIRAIYEESDGRFRHDGEWWVVWPLARVVDSNINAWRNGLSASLLAFGDDGTGDPFCVTLGGDGNEVVRWSWIDAAVESTEGDLGQFLAEWVTDDA